MIKFCISGHKNIYAKHKTTLEFTKDKDLTKKGDCIVGINADFDHNQIQKFVKKYKRVKISLEIGQLKEVIIGETNSSFNDSRKMVIRKSSFISRRTFAINADKAAVDINEKIIEKLKNHSTIGLIKLFALNEKTSKK